MQFSVKTGKPASQKTACAVVPLFEGSPLPPATRAFDKAAGGRIAAMLKAGEISGEAGRVTLIHAIEGAAARRIAAKRVLVVGCGPRRQYDRRGLHKATGLAVRELLAAGVTDAISFLTTELPKDCDAFYGARLSVEAARAAAYRFDELKSKPAKPGRLKRMALGVDAADPAEFRRGVSHGTAIADGADIARDLGNRPPNVCTPTHLADVARDLAKQHKGLTSKALGPKEIEKLGMGSFLSVTQGAVEPPRLIVMQYKGADKSVAPVALCGKGVTFDTGGISIKPSPKMDEMKYDMCGAASVIGTMAAIAALQPAINVVAVVPACENMPSGNATRPGDIYTSMSGKTIEVLNTDAEGRLILCDAMTYAQREFDPAALVDVATLTGACVVALGGLYTGVFSNDAQLREALVDAGARSVDGAWPMPADDEYGDSLRSNFADLANIGSREGGASVAAAFLRRFVDSGRAWAHLDIAGVAWRADAAKGATGRPVALLVDYLLSNA